MVQDSSCSRFKPKSVKIISLHLIVFQSILKYWLHKWLQEFQYPRKLSLTLLEAVCQKKRKVIFFSTPIKLSLQLVCLAWPTSTANAPFCSLASRCIVHTGCARGSMHPMLISKYITMVCGVYVNEDI